MCHKITNNFPPLIVMRTVQFRVLRQTPTVTDWLLQNSAVQCRVAAVLFAAALTVLNSALSGIIASENKNIFGSSGFR